MINVMRGASDADIRALAHFLSRQTPRAASLITRNVRFGSLADVLRLPPECPLSGVKQT